jgi:hypothetical protein
MIRDAYRVAERGPAMANVNENPLGILRGAPEIAKAIRTTPRRAYYLLEKGIIPGVKEGAIWTCTIDRLRQFYEGVQNGGAA